MASASFELQKRIYAALSANAAVTAALGGARVYDAVPRGAEAPYVSFGPMSWRDWSTGTERGEEHTLTLHVWAGAGGHRQAHRVAEAVHACLHDAALTLTGHRLVSLLHESTELRREPGGERHRGFLRFRAVTEPVP